MKEKATKEMFESLISIYIIVFFIHALAGFILIAESDLDYLNQNIFINRFLAEQDSGYVVILFSLIWPIYQAFCIGDIIRLFFKALFTK